MKGMLRTMRLPVLSAGILLLTACVANLAPSYDKAVVDGLMSTNQKLMEFFASATSGTQRTSFDDRQGTYNNIIGSMEALTIQANARPIPQNSVTEKVNEALAKRDVPALDDGIAPSAVAMSKISETMVKMRDTDAKQGVTAFEVLAFKNQVKIYLDQAITYETYLER